MDPFALPCHPHCALTAEDRDWRAVGVRTEDAVLRKQTRCPECKTSYTAFLRRFADDALTVEWVRPVPFRVSAVAPAAPDAPVWQDAAGEQGAASTVPWDLEPEVARLQAAVASLGPAWERSTQLVAPLQVLTAQGEVFAQPGDLLLERREKWNAQDRRLALLWSPRSARQVVAWHGFGRLLQPA